MRPVADRSSSSREFLGVSINDDEGDPTSSIAPRKKGYIRQITPQAPFILGQDPLPPQLRGLWWFTRQGNASALMSFGGPNADGGNCSTGRLKEDGSYAVRVCGDRVWAAAEFDELSQTGTEVLDIIYHFKFDDPDNPQFAQITGEINTNSVDVSMPEELGDYEMELVEDDADFPGSYVWLRKTYFCGCFHIPGWQHEGVELEAERYRLVQVMDENGNQLEPAWSQMFEEQHSAITGDDGDGDFYYYSSVP
mmetsp:Transcript_1231/g.2124  ORF Transcript_1231/g.2124 Transcript_1231/m.2124 type:complete len:251 (-) Transcript_1231:114-866(-)